MGKAVRAILIVIAVLVVLAVIAIACIPLFFNANSLRNKIETELSQRLDRKVTIETLHLDIWSGGLRADNVAIADDPRYSAQPFVQVPTVKIGVNLWPLVLHHQVRIRGFTLQSPNIRLIHAADGTWNYASIRGALQQSAGSTVSELTFPRLFAQRSELSGSEYPGVGSALAELALPTSLSINHLDVRNGRITVIEQLKAGAASTQVYTQVGLHITDFGLAQPFPFTASAHLAGQGTAQAKGAAGPINAQNAASTPFNAHVTLKQVQLGSTGLMAPDFGIAGVLDLQAQVSSQTGALRTTGTAQVHNIKLAKNGTPSPKPLDARFTVVENEQAKTGQINQGAFSVGAATVHVTGGFNASGATTTLDLKAAGQAVPIDAIEAFLPALGIHLPQGSQLRGGALTTNLAVTGAAASPVIDGPVRLDNTQLAGFNLGSQLQTLSTLTGGRIGNATGSATTIRSLSMNVHDTSSEVRTDNVDVEVTGLGSATGSGTVSSGGALDYHMLLKLTGLTGDTASAHSNASPAGGVMGQVAGLLGGGGQSASLLGGVAGRILDRGISVEIGGTTSHPTFTPNIRGLAGKIGAGAAQRVLQGKQAPKGSNSLQKALGGLLGH